MSKLSTALITLITAQEGWEKALEDALNGKKYLSESAIIQLGEAVCKKYGCYVDVADNGMYRFYKTEEVRSDNIHEGAKKMWQRRVAQYHKIERSKRGGARTQVDVIDASRRKAEKFAESHKVVEIRNEIKAIEAYLKALKAYA